jgi:hypothetical protein
MPPNISQIPPKSTADCAVTFTAVGKADKWEAFCVCGFWVRGSKADCMTAANGHRINPVVTSGR